jgi:hypothetical protein
MRASELLHALEAGDDATTQHGRLRMRGHRLERHYLPPDARRTDDGIWVESHITLIEFSRAASSATLCAGTLQDARL